MLFRLPFALSLVLITGISGCGFHLQGAHTAPAAMQRTFIDTEDRHSLFYRELQRELRAAGIEVVDAAANSTATFSIYFDASDERVLSVSARNVPTEYEVYYTVQYGVMSGQEVLLEIQDLTLTRDYTYDSTLVLGKAKEADLMRDAIVRDLVRIVLRQISTQ